MKGGLTEDGYLEIDGINRWCPFGPGDAPCGDWCALFGAVTVVGYGPGWIPGPDYEPPAIIIPENGIEIKLYCGIGRRLFFDEFTCERKIERSLLNAKQS